MYCKYCGKKIDEDSRFCNFCGKKTGESTLISMIKISKAGVKTYLYTLWLCVNFCFYLFGGQGYTTYDFLGRSTTYYAANYLYPNGPIRIYWGTNYYDITDFIFYVVIVPLALLSLYKLFRIWKKK